jgi:ribose transport system permease protein
MTAPRHPADDSRIPDVWGAPSAGPEHHGKRPWWILHVSPEDRPVFVAAGFVVLILGAGTIYTLATQGTATLLQPQYLLQQLQVGAFLGIVAAGMMLVILLGHIDLSVPWTLTAAAMMATAVGGTWAIPAGLATGLLVGLLNGFGVAYLRVPSMIFTLGVNAVMRGLMVAHTGGFAPQTAATDAMQVLAIGRIASVPVALMVWLVVSGLAVVILTRTALGKSIYAVGNRERAAYLSGINTSGVILAAFVLCGLTSAMAGVLLAGYSNKAYQGMGDAYLLPAIAAVVIGGTNILGGRGRYLGTFIGVILIVLLNSVLSIMQMPEAGRQVIYGTVIIAMLLVYGRSASVSS